MNSYINDTGENPKACIIWMHGLGSNANDMASLAQELRLNSPVRHIFIDAPVRAVTLNNHMHMPAWYDIYGLHFGAREDIAGAHESAEKIYHVVEKQLAEGFLEEQIYLAGFSQGGAMALYTGLNFCTSLGGIISLCAYMPGTKENKTITLNTKTPIFFALGEWDTAVQPLWSRLSIDWLEDKGFKEISSYAYSMGHSVCMEEIVDLSQWLQKNININSSEKLNDNR
ncbi:phospholipase/carboxylesterase (plasmid) [Legionella adelaidensis]|uniref:Phospholipase/carboxylesterase n=1 Tax=Legionella adelaidensis TaxID=45056 RepID=A0A0W0R2C1_9GAMM|nr:hypothetical protein [Legionella adelaidensis]KTC65249.1 phospholipase/carboxylesterase [Legionella adelaidensis]VEH86224.1 phospholipase/carboxylesterase [Legionella adelaidensis]